MIEASIKTYYPNARTGQEVTEAYLDLIQKDYHSDSEKVLFATSVCCDDINVSTDFRRVLRRPFTLGGLGGFPYAGLTGISAFAQHIPDGGDAFIFYGPHIGISDAGEIGTMRRPGQKHQTTCCGALLLAHNRLSDPDAEQLTKINPLDTQQMELQQTLLPYREEIAASNPPAKVITDVTYTKIRERLFELLRQGKSQFNCKRIFLLGGVIINTSPEFSDYVDIRDFHVLTPQNLSEDQFISKPIL